MTVRTKLLLSAAACIVCIVILIFTDATSAPFKLLKDSEIVSIEIIISDNAATIIDDENAVIDFAAVLRALVFNQNVDPEGSVILKFNIETTDSKLYSLDIYESFVVLDGYSYTVDSAWVEEIYNLALRFI